MVPRKGRASHHVRLTRALLLHLITGSLSWSIPLSRMSSKEERLLSMVKTAGLPDLEQSDIDRIDEAGRKAHHRAYVSA